MIDLQSIGNRIADIHNMLNDLEIKGGKNAKIIVYAQEHCKSILDEIGNEIKKEHLKKPPVVNLEEIRKESTENDNSGSIEQH